MAQTPSSSDGLLDNEGQRIPLALVVMWNSESSYIICPYCLERHRHATCTGGEVKTRVPHCGPTSGQYQFCYLYASHAQGKYSYRIDKEKGYFVTVGILGNGDGGNESDDYDDAGDMADDTSTDSWGLPIGKDSGNPDQIEPLESRFGGLSVGDPQPQEDTVLKELMQDPSYRQALFASSCITNQGYEIAFLLRKYQDDPFVSRRNKKGENCIALAVIVGDPKIVEYLHQKGGNLENMDNRGWTPLTNLGSYQIQGS